MKTKVRICTRPMSIATINVATINVMSNFNLNININSKLGGI